MKLHPSAVALLVSLTLTACEEVEVRVYAYGLPAGDVHVEVKELGALDGGALEARMREGDVDGAALLPAGSCDGLCELLEVTLFIANGGTDPLAPPVVRLSSPEGRPGRQPAAFRAHEISPGRTGRLRFLLSLWPEERSVDVKLSSSVFLRLAPGGAPAPVGGASGAPTANPHLGHPEIMR